MQTLEKAKILGEAGRYDSCGPRACEVKVDSGLGGIYHARAEHKTCRLFKTLMDNSCSFDCKYCANSNKCGGRRKASYKPAELASLFDYLRKNLRVDGLFLSSGVSGDPDRVTERMIDAVRIMRFKYSFRGYIHFKVLPGTSRELIKQAGELSTRMSINLETPSKSAMDELSSCKDYHIDILRRQSWISALRLGGGQTTQLIVNRLSTDLDVLKMADWEYKSMELRRIYFSAFRPVKGTPLENEPAESPFRQHKLYNADFLLRDYGYTLKEVGAVMEDGMLPREDPKLALAKESFDGAVDVNEATYRDLVRIPGIGPRTARRISGNSEKIKSYRQLQRMGGVVSRAKPFISLGGKRQTMLIDFS